MDSRSIFLPRQSIVLRLRGDAGGYAEHAYWTWCVTKRRPGRRRQIHDGRYELRRGGSLSFGFGDSANSILPRKSSELERLATVPQTDTGGQSENR